MRFLLFFGKA